jgi:hypothetical protein
MRMSNKDMYGQPFAVGDTVLAITGYAPWDLVLAKIEALVDGERIQLRLLHNYDVRYKCPELFHESVCNIRKLPFFP